MYSVKSFLYTAAAFHLSFWFLENICVEYSCYADLKVQGLIFLKKKKLFKDCFSGCGWFWTLILSFVFLFCEQKQLYSAE